MNVESLEEIIRYKPLDKINRLETRINNKMLDVVSGTVLYIEETPLDNLDLFRSSSILSIISFVDEWIEKIS